MGTAQYRPIFSLRSVEEALSNESVKYKATNYTAVSHVNLLHRKMHGNDMIQALIHPYSRIVCISLNGFAVSHYQINLSHS
jgi:hypothetical protein